MLKFIKDELNNYTYKVNNNEQISRKEILTRVPMETIASHFSPYC